MRFLRFPKPVGMVPLKELLPALNILLVTGTGTPRYTQARSSFHAARITEHDPAWCEMWWCPVHSEVQQLKEAPSVVQRVGLGSRQSDTHVRLDIPVMGSMPPVNRLLSTRKALPRHCSINTVTINQTCVQPRSGKGGGGREGWKDAPVANTITIMTQ